MSAAYQADLIYDIGAHIGQDTALYLYKGFRVVAVEANPFLANALHEKFADFVANNQLVIINKMIADEAWQTGTFYHAPNQTLWGTSNLEFVERAKHVGLETFPIPIETITIPELFELFGNPYYIKIDIEGSDMLCVRQLKEIPLASRPKYISIESNKVSFKELREEFNVLESLGYPDFQLSPQHLVEKFQPPKPPLEGAATDYRIVKDSACLFGKELPGKWLKIKAAINAYRPIFLRYWLNGDYGILNNWLPVKSYRHQFRDILGKIGLEAGWYDTHARRPD